MPGAKMPVRYALALQGFLRDQRGMALVEFATLFPVLVLLLFGAYDLSRAADAARGLTRLSNSIATMLATNTTGYVNYTNLHYAFDSAAVVFPEVLRDAAAKSIPWGTDISISMAGVGFAPTVAGCTNGCAYVAQIYWTSGSKNRVCGTSPIPVADNSAESNALALPDDLFTPVATPSGALAPPNFLIVVDVKYTWTPLIARSFLPSISFQRSAFLSARYAPGGVIKYNAIPNDDGFGAECPGY
jgi:Flp pilus assembly protein TadG